MHNLKTEEGKREFAANQAKDSERQQRQHAFVGYVRETAQNFGKNKKKTR